MSTNYYFYPKGFEKLDEVNKVTKSSLEDMTMNYIKVIKLMINDSIDSHPEYHDMFNLDVLKNTLDDTRIILKYDVEIPELHICKLSGGWIPLFNKTNYYSNFDELEEFYNKYKDILYLKNEYDEEISFKELKEKAYNKLKEPRSHLDYNGPYSVFNGSFKNQYYKDKYGFEWTELNNWS